MLLWYRSMCASCVWWPLWHGMCTQIIISYAEVYTKFHIYSLLHHANQSHLAHKHGTSNSRGGGGESRLIRESPSHRSVTSFSTHLWWRCWVRGLASILTPTTTTITLTLTSMCPESSLIQQVVLMELFNISLRWVCRPRENYLSNIHCMTLCTCQWFLFFSLLKCTVLSTW